MQKRDPKDDYEFVYATMTKIIIKNRLYASRIRRSIHLGKNTGVRRTYKIGEKKINFRYEPNNSENSVTKNSTIANY